MKQLDLFSQSSSIEEIAMTGKREPVEHVETGLRPVSTTTEQTLEPSRLAHYRNKLAKLDATGYDEVAEVITSDTIHGHNQLGRDMKIVGTLRRLQWTPEAIATYFLTRRIKNNRTVENGRDRSKGDSK